jgi:hypothetical protein
MSVPGIGGPQFFTHCFNVDIKGDGTVTPPGVKFPGGYKRDDPGVKFNLYVSEAAWDNYVSISRGGKRIMALTSPQIIPGPHKYQGKYDPPKGQQPVVSAQERGLFPPEFQSKYVAYKAKLDKYSSATATMVNKVVPGGKGGKATAKGGDMKTLQEFYMKHYAEGPKLDQEFETLREEAIKLGVAPAKSN